MGNFTVQGIVSNADSRERLQGTTIRLQGAAIDADDKEINYGPLFTNSDLDGRFKFTVTNWPQDSENKPLNGNCSVVAYHPNCTQPEPISLTLKRNDKDELALEPASVNIDLVSRYQISRTSGVVFLIALLVILSTIVTGHIVTHANRPSRVPINDGLSNLIATAQRDVEQLIAAGEAADAMSSTPTASTTLTETAVTAGATLTETVAAEEDAEAVADADTVAGTIEAAQGVYETLISDEAQTLFDAQRQLEVTALFAEALEAADAEEWGTLRVILATLETTFIRPNRYFWEEPDLRYIEILSVALVATLIRLAIKTGAELADDRFLKHSIGPRVALLFAVPIIALLVTFVLSLVTISIAVSGTTFVLDMSNITIAIVVAALIGLAPYKAWGFLSTLADKLFDALTPGKQEENEAAGAAALPADPGSADAPDVRAFESLLPESATDSPPPPAPSPEIPSAAPTTWRSPESKLDD